MKPTSPPWCLHWDQGGELDPSDRLDLLLVLSSFESGWTQQALNQVALNSMTKVSAGQAER